VFDDLRPEPDVPPPALGANTREVLASCDFAQSEIEEMINAGVASAQRAS
jgi:crotonobetainyl-CoA:carnitine CoA-transferase CaiB-like acyl-CoA transferase